MFARDEAARERFDREARAIASLSHSHICTLHDVGHDGDTHFLVMELLEGGTLAERLAKGPLPLAHGLNIARENADALDQAHRHGIVHRDLTPGNIFLTRSGAKLLDFGLAKAARAIVAGNLSVASTAASPITANGTIVGTLNYMAPEQLQADEADARSDIWALGCVIYEMVTGARPFDGATSVSVMAAILERQPEPLRARQPISPPALEHVVRRCLEKDPDERWQSARDVLGELRWIGQSSSTAVATERVSRLTRRVQNMRASRTTRQGPPLSIVLQYLGWLHP
jgi:eukaryotic-like serine/threonine-protein kinase